MLHVFHWDCVRGISCLHGKVESVEKGNLSQCLKVSPKVQSGDYFKTWILPEYLVNELLIFSWENSSSFQKLSIRL